VSISSVTCCEVRPAGTGSDASLNAASRKTEVSKPSRRTARTADIEVELESLSRQYNQPREKILELLGANVGALVDGIVRTKTIDSLIERAKIVPAATKPSAG